MERKYRPSAWTSVEETMLQNILHYVQFRLFVFLMTLSKLQPSMLYNVAPLLPHPANIMRIMIQTVTDIVVLYV
jgi:hypothetical protein